MTMSYIWSTLIGISLLFSLLGGTTAAVSAAALEGATTGVTLTISLAGALCLWSGLARVMERAGLTQTLARWMRPLLQWLLPQAAEEKATLSDICANLSANLLGLGNAATPFGISAVKRMKARSGSESASDEMCLLIVMNTASIQLIPTTVAAVRASLGAARPFDILPAVWATSVLSLTVGIVAAKGLRRYF